MEAVRVGWIFANDSKQYGRWQRSLKRKAAVLSPAGLEAAVMALAARNPEYVIVEGV